MKKILSVLVVSVLLLCCNNETTPQSTLYLYFVASEDGSPSLLPGIDSRNYILGFNDEQIELTKPEYVIENLAYGTYTLTCTATDNEGMVCGALEAEIEVDATKVIQYLTLPYIEPAYIQEYPEVTEGGVTSGDSPPSGGDDRYSYESAIFRFKYLGDMADVEFSDLTEASDTISIRVTTTLYSGSTDFLEGCLYEVDMIWLDSSAAEQEGLIFSGTFTDDLWGETQSSTGAWDIEYNAEDDEYTIGLKSVRIWMPDLYQVVDWTNALIAP